MTLDQWVIRWGIPAAAARELQTVLAGHDHAPPPVDPATLSGEARVQSLVRIDAAQNGVWLTRNNVGAYLDPATNRLVRYGLANESKAQNQAIKSADLIGFRQRVIVQSDVGTSIAQFVSRECKAEGWRYKGTSREVAQAAWRDFINANGGDASFVSGVGSFIQTKR